MLVVEKIRVVYENQLFIINEQTVVIVDRLLSSTQLHELEIRTQRKKKEPTCGFPSISFSFYE